MTILLCIAGLVLVIAGAVGVAVGNRQRKAVETEKNKLEETMRISELHYREIVAENKALGQIKKDVLLKARQEKHNETVSLGYGESLTGNKYLDTVIGLKKVECAAKHIYFIYTINADCSHLPFTDASIVSLFQNLLDNSIEACERAKEGRKSYIILEIQELPKEKQYKILVENSKLKREAPLALKFETSKDDKKLHGRGVGIIKNKVQDARGTIEWKDKGESFRTEISVPFS